MASGLREDMEETLEHAQVAAASHEWAKVKPQIESRSRQGHASLFLPYLLKDCTVHLLVETGFLVETENNATAIYW